MGFTLVLKKKGQDMKMDWNIFWSAFGAIGTTIGSLTTAFAVVVAVKQYKQPIEKRISVTHGMSFPIMVDDTLGDTQVHIEVKNLGIRDITISAFYLKNKKKKYWLNRTQSDVNQIDFPYVLKPEEGVSFYINYKTFVLEMKKLAYNKNIRNYENFKVCVQDTLGVMHYDKKIIKYRNGKIK